jgi:membrane-associated protease RseP (regulator of RpoE activity)
VDESRDQQSPPFVLQTGTGGANLFDIPPTFPPRERAWRHVVLFALTVVSTCFVGAFHFYSFSLGFNPPADASPDLMDVGFWIRGLWYSLTVLAILGCHELGHYYACRYYGVDATLPFFLPAPLPLTGTLGAFIRIRSRMPSKVALFDIGLSGPIAGFIIAVPALFIGLGMSVLDRVPADFSGVELGEPLLFRAAAWMVWGSVPDGLSINMHPMAFAAWFGLLATALNLFPLGQLDGGHVAYAVLGRRSTLLTVATVGLAIGLTFISSSWIVWTVLMVVMLLVIGPRHPPTLDDTSPLGAGRLILAALGLIMLIVCFTPAPIEPFVTGQP